MPSNEPRRQVIHLLKQQHACAGVFLFSLFLHSQCTQDFTMDEPRAGQSICKFSACKVPAFCRSACFQLPTLLAKRIHPTSVCDFSSVVHTDCSGKSGCSLESGWGIRCCKHLETQAFPLGFQSFPRTATHKQNHIWDQCWSQDYGPVSANTFTNVYP